MKKVLLLALVLQGCSDRAVKRMIIEPEPPVPIVTVASCHLHFDTSANLQQIAKQAAQISEECNYTDEEFQNLIESALK